MKKIERVVISLDIIPKGNFEIFKRHLPELSSASLDEIWTYYPVRNAAKNRCPVDNQHASFIEPFLLINYLNERDIPYSLWYDNAICIMNDDLYRFTQEGPIKENLRGTYFFTLREWFRHPFFTILKTILRQQKGDLVKPNAQSMINPGCMNKFFGLCELYELRSKYIQDIAVPYNLKPHHYPAFVDLIRANMGPHVVFKQDCIQEGAGVMFADLDNKNIIESVSPYLARHMNLRQEVMITPAHQIEREFRCYFVKNYRLKIYAIKERKNVTTLKEMLGKKNIHIGTNIVSKWSAITPGMPDHALAENIAREMLGFLSYDTGCLEFAITNEGNIVYFEVNPMAAPLPFAGKDLALTNDYYSNLFDMMLGSSNLEN
jgi:hypothetical protein